MRWAFRSAALLALSLAGPVQAQPAPIEEARRILEAAPGDPSAIDRARDGLEAAVLTAGLERADPALVTELARIWFLYGELRTAEGDARTAAFARGRELGESAVLRAPSDPQAHLWYAVNLARWAEERGILRSMLEISTVKSEVAETLRLAPDLPDAHAFAGGLASHLPRSFGGSAVRAEEHFRRAVALDPRRTRFRLELAELLIDRERFDEARREIRHVLEETAPSDPLVAALRDRPRAERLLAEIGAAE